MLQSLELAGFKSFAERTEFRFAAGLTAVVGPNGSGKSNVVDAIKWVLGDQSAKSLRGKEMTDVIFNGAAGRKPGNAAEAVLTFDNAAGYLPTPDKTVAVGRRIWRNGDSEYLLNGQVVRLKDVRDLFLGTGAGASAYAIIEQGRVDQILQANAAGRRAVFEEAAGISRYRAKKTDALKRLERVEQNLSRLTDVVDEAEAKLTSTRTQAAKAAKHREVSQELERWWLGLAADEQRHADAELSKLRTSLAENQTQLEAIAAEQSALDSRLSSLDSQLASADEALRSTEAEASAVREQIAGHEATVGHQSARLEELDGETVRVRRQFAALSARSKEAETERDHNLGVLASSDRDLDERRRTLAVAEAELHELSSQVAADRAQIAGDRRRQLERMRQVSDAENRAAAVAAERDAAAAGVESAADRLTSLDRDFAAAEAAAADRQAAADEAEAEVRVRRGRADDLRDAREKVAADRERIAADMAALREHKSAVAARVGVLEDMQARGEGFGIGVREILRRARTVADPPWNRIHGTVSDLLDVDLDEAPLLEVALGDRAQLVVIEDFESLLPYLSHSSAKIAGRVGFLSQQGLPPASGTAPFTSEFAGARYIEAYPRRRNDGGVEGRNPGADAPGSPVAQPSTLISRPDLRGLPGVLKRADELVRPTSRMPHLAGRLLADTWVVETLDVALRLAAGHGRGLRFVTPAGELLDADGTLVVGTLRAEAAVVSRRSELLRQRDEVEEAGRRIEDAERRKETLADSQEGLTDAFAAAESELRATIDRRNRGAAEFAEADRRCRRVADERTAVAADLAARRRRLEELAGRIAAAETARETARHDLETIETGLSLAEASVAETERRAAEIQTSLAADRLEVAKAEERVVALRNSLARLERDAEGRAAQLAEASRRLDATTAKRSETTLRLLNASALFAEAVLRRDAHADSVRGELSDRDALRRRRSEFAAADDRLRSRRRTLADARHSAELGVREIEQRLSVLADRIREEYGIELPDVAAAGASALGMLAEERPPVQGQGTRVRRQDDDQVPEIVPAARDPLPLDPGPLTLDASRQSLEARVDRLRKKLRLMGAVDADSLADLDELETRYTRLAEQLQDLVEAKRTLEDLIRRINVESRRLFAETFEAIRENFRELFRKLFGGGEGDIVLEDPNDVLESGIDVIARPPGKELQRLSLLSGGEKALVCVTLLLAIFKNKPSPFCLLDEVDAPLDEANIGRFVNVLKEFMTTTQFIMITHRKPSMCEADVLYGVTMEQAGVSKRLNVRFDDVAEDGSFKTAKRAA